MAEPLPLLPCGALAGACRPLLLLLLSSFDELLPEPLSLDELLPEPLLLDELPELLVPVPDVYPLELEDDELLPVLVTAA